jgi:hypothetical protein
MKKLLFSIVALTLTTGIFAQKKSDDVAKIKTETIDLGKIKQDNPTPAVFDVTNIGTEDLLIEQANPTCGCTISDYTKDKIAPGKSGYIKATYNAKNIGMFEKHLTVKFAGCDDMKSITIKGEVIKNEDAAATPATAPVAAPAVEAAPLTDKAAPAKTAATSSKVAPAKKAPAKKAATPAKP